MKGPLIGLDMTEVSAFAVELTTKSFLALKAAEGIVEVGSRAVAEEAAVTIRAADRNGRLRQYPKSITSEVETKGTDVEGTIGPDKDKAQGPLGNILEYGTSRTPPIPHLQPALDHQAPLVAEALAASAVLLLKSGVVK